jgi:hypothetical protein
MARYTRHQPAVIRESDSSSSEDNWMNQLAKNLERNAVEPRQQKSMYDQINNIMNNSKKSKFSSVDDAVKDMQERSGLTAYLEKVKKAANRQAEKKAQAQNSPTIFSTAPMVKNTLENFVHETRGNATVPAILEKIKEIHRMDVPDPKDWEDDNLIRYISALNAKEKAKFPVNNSEYMDLGRSPHLQDKDIDAENTDAFHSLMPATK